MGLVRVGLEVGAPSILDFFTRRYLGLAADVDSWRLSVLDGAVVLEGARLSPPGGGPPVAAVRYARADLQITRLARGEVVLERVEVDGLDATIDRGSDGRLDVVRWFKEAKARRKPSEPPGFLIETGRISAATVRFRDRSVSPPTEIAARIEARVDRLGTLATEATQATLHLDSPELGRLSLAGEGRPFAARSPGLVASVEVEDLDTRALAPYLGPQVRSTPSLNDARFRLRVEGGLPLEATLEDLRIESDGETAVAVERARLRISKPPAEDRLAVDEIEIVGLDGQLARLPDGRLKLAGLELLLGIAPPAEPREVKHRLLAFRRFEARDWSLRFTDWQAEPAFQVEIADLDALVQNLVLGAKGSGPRAPSPFRLEARSSDAFERLAVAGLLSGSYGVDRVAAQLVVRGLAPHAFASYLAPRGVQALARRLDLDLKVEAAREDVRVLDLKLLDGDGHELAGLDEARLVGFELDPAAGALAAPYAGVRGLRGRLRRDPGGGLTVAGLRFGGVGPPPAPGMGDETVVPRTDIEATGVAVRLDSPEPARPARLVLRSGPVEAGVDVTVDARRDATGAIVADLALAALHATVRGAGADPGAPARARVEALEVARLTFGGAGTGAVSTEGIELRGLSLALGAFGVERGDLRTGPVRLVEGRLAAPVVLRAHVETTPFGPFETEAVDLVGEVRFPRGDGPKLALAAAVSGRREATLELAIDAPAFHGADGRGPDFDPGPVSVRASAGLAGVVDRVRLAGELAPFGILPAARLRLEVEGLDVPALVAAIPALGRAIDPEATGLVRCWAGADLTVELGGDRGERRFGLGFDPRRPFSADLTLRDLDVRRDPAGAVVARLDGVHVEVARFDPRTYETRVSEIEVLGGKGLVARTPDGRLRVGDIVFRRKAARGEEEEGAEAKPAGEAAGRPGLRWLRERGKIRLRELPGIRVDELRFVDVELEVADAAVAPRLDARIHVLDLEAANLSVRALEERLPIHAAADLAGGGVFHELGFRLDAILAPPYEGSAEIVLRGLDLRRIAGYIQDARGLRVTGGIVDVGGRLTTDRAGRLTGTIRIVATDLEISEPPGGTLSQLLDTPLEVALVALRDESGAVRIDLPVDIQLDEAGIAGGRVDVWRAARGALLRGFENAFRRVGAFVRDMARVGTGWIPGIGGVLAGAPAVPPVTVRFEPGAVGVEGEGAEALRAFAREAARWPEHGIILRATVGPEERARALELAAPPADDLAAVAARFAGRRLDIEGEIDDAYAVARAAVEAGDLRGARLARERIGALEVELDRLDRAVDRHDTAAHRATVGLDRGATAWRGARAASTVLADERAAAVYGVLAAEGIAADRVRVLPPRLGVAEGGDGAARPPLGEVRVELGARARTGPTSE